MTPELRGSQKLPKDIEMSVLISITVAHVRQCAPQLLTSGLLAAGERADEVCGEYFPTFGDLLDAQRVAINGLAASPTIHGI